MKTLGITIRGTSPMLMNSNQGVNPVHPLVVELKKLSKLRNRTEEQEIRILDIKWNLGLYWDQDIGVYTPAANIEAMFRNAAKSERSGTDALKAILIRPDFVPLIYDGPKDIESLEKDIRFRDVRAGKIKKAASVLLCRPRFNSWALKFEIDFDEKFFDEDKIINLLEYGGRYVGLNDYRPRYGKFEIVEVTK